MKMNENVVKGKWLEIKGEVQKAWGRLTDDELEKSKGDLKAIAGLVQQRYGESQAASEDKVSQIFKRFDDKKDEKISSIKSSLKQ